MKKRFLIAAAMLLAAVPALAQGPGGGPGPGPVPSPWAVNGPTISYSAGGITMPIGVTGGTKGVGTINLSGGYYVNGVALDCALLSDGGTACSKNSGTSGATVPLNNGGFTQSGTANFTGAFQVNGNVVTWPAAAITVARIDAAQSFAGLQTFARSILIGAATGGDQGVGTINATGIYINGAALSSTVVAPAGTLTGTTLAANVVTSSLTTIGTLIAGAVPTTLLTGTVTNGQLANSAITIGTTSISLGATASTLAGVTSYNKVAITAPATGSTLTIADGKTATFSNTITIAGTDATVMTFPATSQTIPGAGSTNAFSGANSYSGLTTWTGSLIVPMRTFTGVGAITVSATTDYFICVNKASGAATTVNLPGSPTTGLTYLVKDCKGDAATNNITVTPASGNIDNAGTYVISTNLASVGVTYSGSQWLVN